MVKVKDSVGLVRKQIVWTERPSFVGEVSAKFCGEVSRGQSNGSPQSLISVFETRSRYFSIQVAPQLSLQGLVEPVPDPLLLRKIWLRRESNSVSLDI
jgi:hypothetical protein